jgi:hypothetical protein
MIERYSPLMILPIIGFIVFSQTLVGFPLHAASFAICSYCAFLFTSYFLASFVLFFSYLFLNTDEEISKLSESYKKESEVQRVGRFFQIYLSMPLTLVVLSFYGWWWSFLFMFAAQICAFVFLFLYRKHLTKLLDFLSKVELVSEVQAGEFLKKGVIDV